MDNNSTEKFVSVANTCVSLRLIKSEQDLHDDSLDFAPEFCHQFFGENEAIFGYTGLKVRLFCTFCDALTFLQITYKEKCDPKRFNGVQPDDIAALIKKQYPEHGIQTDMDKFRQSVSNQYLCTPFGRLLYVYHAEKGGGKREFQVYKVDGVAAKGRKFTEFYERIEMFAFWYIDAASCVDTSDDKWQFYITYEKFQDESQRVCYGFVGYSSVYEYYAYPENVRPRIGHFLIVPPYHKSGHGFNLLQTIYNDLVANPKVLEIVAEDPAFDFVKLRDYVDATNCSDLDSFRDTAELKTLGFSKDMVDEMRVKLKIGRKQARRIYEILRLKATDTSNEEEFKAYRLDVKRRLYKPFKKSAKDWASLSKVLSAQETAAAALSMTRENVHLSLQSLFEQTMDEYKFVLDRLAVRRSLPAVHPASAKNGH